MQPSLLTLQEAANNNRSFHTIIYQGSFLIRRLDKLSSFEMRDITDNKHCLSESLSKKRSQYRCQNCGMLLDTLDWNKYHKSCPVSPVGEHGTVWESMPAAGSINHILSKWLSWKTFFSQPGAKQRSDTGEWSDAATTIQQHCTVNRCLEKTEYKWFRDLFQGFDTSVCYSQSMQSIVYSSTYRMICAHYQTVHCYHH